MSVIATHLTVAPDGTISIATKLPAGEHAVTVTVADGPARTIDNIRSHPGNWDDSISMRREDMYGDDGR